MAISTLVEHYVFDISSQSKQKLRVNGEVKLSKSMLIETEYPNLLHGCDFLCFNLMNYNKLEKVRCTPVDIYYTCFKGAQSRFARFEKFSLILNFKFSVCNPCQSSPSLTILVPLWFIIISLMFFYLSKLLFSGFLPFKGDFVRGQKQTKHCD